MLNVKYLLLFFSYLYKIDNANGSVAHLGERLHGMEEVASSILVRSTKITRYCRSPKSLIRSWTKRRIHRQPSERAVFLCLELADLLVTS